MFHIYPANLWTEFSEINKVSDRLVLNLLAAARALIIKRACLYAVFDEHKECLLRLGGHAPAIIESLEGQCPDDEAEPLCL